MRIRDSGAPIVQAIITLWILAILAGGVQAQTTQIWTVPEVGALPYDANGLLVRRGRDLITATYAYIGPNVPDVSQRHAGNNLACSNCHLSAGVRKFALPLFGLSGEFPQYSPRSADRNYHRRPHQFLHDAEHERSAAPAGRVGDAGHCGVHQVSE